MEYLTLYAVFALATGLTALYELLAPVIKKQKLEEGSVENELLTYGTFFCIFVLSAPVGFLSCIIPSWGIIFRETLQKALFSTE
jgi:hypothetical protein